MFADLFKCVLHMSILRVFGTVKNIKDHEKHQDHSIGRRGSHSSRMGLFLKKEDLSLYPNLDQDLIKKSTERST